jgi:uncharacterized protein (TIGR00369 family)
MTRNLEDVGGQWQESVHGGYMDDVGPIQVRRGENGELRFGLRCVERHLNGHGIVHGGVVMSFLDHALGMFGFDAHRRHAQATIQLNVMFISAVRAGDFLEAACETVRVTRSAMFMRGTAFVGERIAATADGVWHLRRDQEGTAG